MTVSNQSKEDNLPVPRVNPKPWRDLYYCEKVYQISRQKLITGIYTDDNPEYKISFDHLNCTLTLKEASLSAWNVYIMLMGHASYLNEIDQLFQFKSLFPSRLLFHFIFLTLSNRYSPRVT
jgi:hypothetical protein